jgi:hypothetical protein
MGQYDRIKSPYGGGTYTNSGMVNLVKTYCAIKGISLKQFYVMQGSFNTTVKASAGTHDKADCMDAVDSVDEKWLKKIGAFAWARTRAQGFTPHVHFGRMYSTKMAWLATAQDKAYRAHKSNGLGNLSHTDTSWCPRYRSVKHISGPSTRKYVATKETWGYSQAGCHSDKDKDLKIKTRAKGYVLGNIAGRVQANGSDYFVTTGGTFYNVSNFTPYVAPPKAPKVTTYYVRGPFAIGHKTASAAAPKVGTPKPWGSELNISKTSTVNGAKWGYATVGGVGRWYLMANLTSAKPTKEVKKIGTLTIGGYNTAAQASGHEDTYRSRSLLSAKHIADSGADVFLVCEYGSGTTEIVKGKTFLSVSDASLKEASKGDMARVSRGGNWRYVLYRKSTTDYIANTGKLVTLPTKADSDGNQIAMAIISKNGVKHLVCAYHFDVDASTATKKKQAVDTLKAVEKYRHEKAIYPWNVSIGGDSNDSTGSVEAVFATWGFKPLAESPYHVNALKRTTNHWKDEWTTGPRLDDIYVPEGTGESWRQIRDAKASDHNPHWGVRASYGA